MSENESPVNVIKTGDKIQITLDKNYIQKHSNFDILKLVALAMSPIFTNENKKPITQENIKQSGDGQKTGFPHIAFFIENVGHYTGGRYSSWLQAVILSHFTKVTVVSNSKPVFYGDFKYYTNSNPNFNFIKSDNYLIDNEDNDFDIIVGVPQLSGQFAASYAGKFSIPLYLVIFETPNWIREFRDGVDADDDFWESYKKCMYQADHIITISYESEKWIRKWDAAFADKDIKVLYPCINEAVAKKINDEYKPIKDKKYRILFSSRMAPFKNPLAIIRGLPKNIEFNIIGKVWSHDTHVINNMIKDGYNINFLGTISDKEKFKLIKMSDLVIHPSKFEGFGMIPMEAIYFGKNVVAYDLPVLQEVYKKAIITAKLGNRQDFIQTIKKVIKEPYKLPIKNKINFPFITIKRNIEKQKEIFGLPKISFGVLAFNCADYLEYAIKSIYNLAHQIIIVEGAVEGYSDEFESNDGTLEIIKKLKKDDIWNKIQVIRNYTFWKSKIHMQNKIANSVTGDFYIKMDADEIWKPETVQDVINIMINNPNIQTIKMPFKHFWTSFGIVAADAGGKWSTKHHRVWRWKKTFRHRKSFNHFIDTADDNKPVVAPYVEEYTYDGEYIYHMGYARKQSCIRNKLHYYAHRNIEKYVKDNYSIWKNMSDKTQCTQQSRSWAEKFSGILPEVLNNHPYFGIKDIRKLK